MSETVWTIEDGEHSDSDYRVHAVYSTKKQATDVLEACGIDWTDNPDSDGPRVVERPLNPHPQIAHPDYDLWNIFMHPDGEVVRCNKRSATTLDDLFNVELWIAHRQKIFGYVVARSKEHAVKIVNEFRAQAIAEGRMDTATGDQP